MLLDAGPDNVGCTRMICDELRGQSNAALLVQFCLLHQFSLMMLYFYTVADGFLFDGEADVKPGYVASVATVANCWRCPGVGKLLWATCAELFGEATAYRVAGKTPGRAVKTRWGSLNSVERIIVEGHVYLSTTFAQAFKKALEPPAQAKAPKKRGLLADVDDDRREQTKQYRVTAARKLCDVLFVAKCIVSDAAQRPLSHFHLWVQKKSLEVNKASKQQKGKAYMGTTAISELVCWKAQSIRDDFNALLTTGSGDDASRWGALWSLTPRDRVAETRALIITLVCSAVCQWDMRITSRITSFPYVFLLMVEKGPSEVDERRRAAAAMALSKPECCLASQQQDFTLKLLRKFRVELLEVARTGKCPHRLHSLLMLVRSLWFADTQKVEGANSVLQTICKRAPNIHVPLLSDRLSMKLGESLVPKDCCALHTDVVLRQADALQAERYTLKQATLPLPAPQGVGEGCDSPIRLGRRRVAQQLALVPVPEAGSDQPAPPRSVCVHEGLNDTAGRLAKGIQSHCADTLSVDARQVVQLELKIGTVTRVTRTSMMRPFIMGTKYYKTCWCVGVNLLAATDPPNIVVQLPLVVFTLWDELALLLRNVLGENDKLKHIVVHTYTVQWTTLTRGMSTHHSSVRRSPKPAPTSQPKRQKSAAEVAEDSACFEVPGDGDAPQAFDIEAALAGVLEDSEEAEEAADEDELFGGRPANSTMLLAVCLGC